MEKDKSYRESAGVHGTSQRPSKQTLERVWRTVSGGTDLEGSDTLRSTEEARGIFVKSKLELFPNWDTILTQKGIFSLSPNSMSQRKRI